jgi:ABC-type Na+ efflux pump permease subunit
MRLIWVLAKKEFRLLLRDPKAAVILLVMPFLFILVLGVSLGEGFGQKPDARLRVSIVILDKRLPAGVPFPKTSWASVVQRDLAETAGIRLEIIEGREEAQRLVDSGKRAAVLVFGPKFSELVNDCSFLAKGINPFHRDGVNMHALDVELLRDPTQLTAASIIEQVAQGTLLRVILPWMIGRAFEKVGDVEFIDQLGRQSKGVGVTMLGVPVKLSEILPLLSPAQKQELGNALQKSLKKLFPRYNLTAKTWAALTKSREHSGGAAEAVIYREGSESGLLKRGALRYQLLVPSYTVMFAFFMVLTVGWLFVAERRQGTLKRLRAAPLTRRDLLIGKFIPCFFLSVAQGLLLMLAGKIVFGMSWGPEPLWLLAVVAGTSWAAMGLALLVATLARTETQVAIYGTLLVLMLAGISGCLMGDRALMPEQMQEISRFTPHAWAMDAYLQLLRPPSEEGTTSPAPHFDIVARACFVLAGFGLGFILLAWWALKLE